MIRRPPRSTLFPYTSSSDLHPERFGNGAIEGVAAPESANNAAAQTAFIPLLTLGIPDRKSTRLNSSHGYISYAVFCLKKKKKAAYLLHITIPLSLTNTCDIC